MNKKVSLIDKSKIMQKYNNLTMKKVQDIVEDVFKDYKDPTEHMTLGQKKMFDEAFKKLVKERYIIGCDPYDESPNK
jgi:uncharacterized protein YktB (UPF0637 family)